MEKGRIYNYLTSKMKDKKMDLVAIYFDGLSVNPDFVGAIESLTKNEGGTAGEYLVCYFPKQLDEYQLTIGEGFDGIEFSLFEDKISIDILTFRKYLRMACEIYWSEYPKTKFSLEKLLARPQPPLEDETLPLWKQMRDAGKFDKPYSEL